MSLGPDRVSPMTTKLVFVGVPLRMQY